MFLASVVFEAWSRSHVNVRVTGCWRAGEDRAVRTREDHRHVCASRCQSNRCKCRPSPGEQAGKRAAIAVTLYRYTSTDIPVVWIHKKTLFAYSYVLYYMKHKKWIKNNFFIAPSISFWPFHNYNAGNEEGEIEGDIERECKHFLPFYFCLPSYKDELRDCIRL
jgi:hypothetical protein